MIVLHPPQSLPASNVPVGVQLRRHTLVVKLSSLVFDARSEPELFCFVLNAVLDTPFSQQGAAAAAPLRDIRCFTSRRRQRAS